MNSIVKKTSRSFSQKAHIQFLGKRSVLKNIEEKLKAPRDINPTKQVFGRPNHIRLRTPLSLPEIDAVNEGFIDRAFNYKNIKPII